ncbi:hypothetical protein DNU06_15975 [Putridiphycobacter roseus]|uniref:Secretion system C-terminal sorting domain-containing protein n=1 Tax=Putridiphycobacter roseus TaxID=2219161 RepID=A0A2W1NCM6_9FLAO|nr:T9SS type A sorting domain-containing protein [Putridiphycobacter roseus]PZE15876.1 hypothetical protein DNU06_15975 [Putridiphycobacter roseus]
MRYLIISIAFLLSFSLHCQTINSGEYFFDSDPGYGNGTPIPSFTASNNVNFNFTANTTGLAAGYHFLYIRFKDSNNEWGIYAKRAIHILAPIPTVSAPPNITFAEYFFDTDPGYGNGIAFPSFTANDSVDLNFLANTSGLSAGYHKIFIRLKDENEEWSIYAGRTIYIMEQAANTMASVNITNAEYFFDTDPGYGNGVMLPSFAPSDTVDHLFSAPTTNLAAGVHQLYVRYKDSLGEWGIYAGRAFEVLNCSNPIPNFTVQSNCAGDSITLVNTSTNADSLYLWDFNDDQVWDNFTAGNVTFFPAFTDSGKVKLKLVNKVGCTDSISLTIILPQPQDTLLDLIACDSALINGNWYFTNQLVIDTLVTNAGCDSIVKTNLSLYSGSNSSISVTACNSYTLANGTVITNSGTYADTTSSVNGCDSIITTVLTINPVGATSTTLTVCDFYISPTGNMLTNTGIYKDTITTSNGCDSIITTNLTVNSITAGTISFNAGSLFVNATAASYQWLDCDNLFSEISGATNPSFSPTINGNYACKVIGVNGCVDTTSCTMVNNVGLNEGSTNEHAILIYPNPTTDILIVEMDEQKALDIKIYDAVGKVVYSQSTSNTAKVEINISELAAGQYYIHLSNNLCYTSEKIVIH